MSSVCLFFVCYFCPQHNSKTNDLKVFKLGVRNDLGNWDILEVMW